MDKAHRKLSFEYAKTSVAEIVAYVGLAYSEIFGAYKHIIVPDVLDEYFKSFRFRNFVTFSEQN